MRMLCNSLMNSGRHSHIHRFKQDLAYCSDNKLDIISDSFEFAVNDYLSTKDENEYITKIMFYVKKSSGDQSNPN